MVFDKNLYGKWVLAMALGELFGFLAPVAVGVAGVFIIGEATTTTGIILTLLFAAVGGLGEGSILAFFQSRVLKDHLPRFNTARFVLYTGFAAAAAWILGMMPSTLGDPTKLPPIFLILFGLIGIPVFLLSIGGVQWLELRKHIKKAWAWIIVNAIAWPVGVAIPVIGIQLVPDNSPIWAFVATGIFCGTLMGATVGAITGLLLLRLLRRPE